MKFFNTDQLTILTIFSGDVAKWIRILSVSDRAYTPPVVNNMAEAPVHQQTKRKIVNV
jgi:hypothetical protein